MRLIYLAAAILTSLSAQVTNLRVVGVTPQQVTLAYHASSAAACTLTGTSGGILADTVYDLSNSEFSGANSDLSRTTATLPLTDTFVVGLDRQITIGHRGVAKGSGSGLRRSLSLQAATPYTFTVCGTSIAVTTAIPPPGNIAPESSSRLFDSTAFGNLGWPDVDWTAGSTNGLYSSQVIVDPLTGTAYTPFTWFNAVQFCSDNSTNCASGGGTNPFNAYFNSSGTWTNPANILSGSGGSLASTTDTTPMFVAIGGTLVGDLGNGGSSSSVCSNFVGGCFISDIQVSFTGNMSGGTKVVHFCLTADSGQTCFSGSQTVTLTGSTTTVCFPACGTALVAPFTEWGIAASAFPYADLVWPWTTTVNAATSTLTQTTAWPSASGQGWFPVDYPAGAKIIVATSSCANHLCTAASVTNANTATISESIGTLTGVAATAANFGIKITNDASGGTLNLTVTYGVTLEQTPGFAIADGASDQVSRLQTNVTRDRDGSTISSTPVYLAHVEYHGHPGLYAFNAANGHVWPIGNLYNFFSGGIANNASSIPALNPWDFSNSNVWYGGAFESSASQPEWAKNTYLGNGTPYTPGAHLQNLSYGTVPNGQSASGTGACTGGQTAGNVCVQLLTTVASHDIRTSIAALLPLYTAGGISGNPSVQGVTSSGYLVGFWPGNGGQNSIGAWTFTNLTTINMDCAADSMLGVNCGAGQAPGSVFGGGVHTAGGWFPGGRFVSNLMVPLGSEGSGNWLGPFYNATTQLCTAPGVGVGIASCAAWSATTTLTPSFAITCPASECGVPVPGAIAVQTAGDLCSTTPASGEKSAYPCPWNSNYSLIRAPGPGAQLGDTAALINGAEIFTILAKDVISPTQIVWWLLRATTGSTAQSHSNSWNLALQSSGGGNFSLDTGTSPMLWYASQQNNAHQDFGTGPTGGYNYAGGSKIGYNVPVSTAGIQSTPTSVANWGGVWMRNVGDAATGGPFTLPGNGQIETYGSCRQWNASNLEKVWCADYRAYQCGSFVSSGDGCAPPDTVTLTQITAGGRTHIWQYAGRYTDLSKLFPMDGFAGPYAMQDASSSTANSFTDSSPAWSFCRAYKANECVTGSVAGNVYYYGANTLNTLTSWYSNNMEGTAPFLNNASPVAPWAVQFDLQQSALNPNYVRFYRRIGQGLGGQTRNYVAQNWRPTPDGSFGLVLTQFVGGQFPLLWLAKLPPWPGYDATRRDGYQFARLSLGPGAALAEIRFGYEEYGGYCMPRQEQCLSVATPVANNPATPNNGTPFNWITADGHSGTSCASGCTIQIPAVSGRMLFWQEFRSADGGTTWFPRGQLQQLAVQ